jgi:large subunit ribosomal protein L21
MYAIVDIAGQQFKVEKENKIFVHRLDAEEGATVEFEKIFLVDNEDGDIKVGKPIVEGAKITAKVLAHLKGDKLIVFKKKRRKGYQKKNGHRQYLSQIQIEDIQIG